MRQFFFAVGKPHRPMDAKLTGEDAGHLPDDARRWFVDTFSAARLSSLRAELAAIPLEKSAQVNEIAAAVTTPIRKEEVVLRYSILTKKLQATTNALEEFHPASG